MLNVQGVKQNFVFTAVLLEPLQWFMETIIIGIYFYILKYIYYKINIYLFIFKIQRPDCNYYFPYNEK